MSFGFSARSYLWRGASILAVGWLGLEIALMLPKLPPRTVADWMAATARPFVALSVVALLAIAEKPWIKRLLSRKSETKGWEFAVGCAMSLAAGMVVFVSTYHFGLIWGVPVAMTVVGLQATALLLRKSTLKALSLFLIMVPVLNFVLVEIIQPTPLLDSVGETWRLSPEVAYMLLIALASVSQRDQAGTWVRPTTLNIAVLVLLASTLTSCAWSQDVELSLVYWMEGIFLPVVLFYTILRAVKSEESLKLLMFCLVLALLAASAYQLHKTYQTTGFSLAGFLASDSTDDAFRRSPTFRNANLAAAYLVLPIPLALGMLASVRNRLEQLVCLLSFIAGIGAVMVNYTRGAYVAVTVELLVLTALNNKVRRWVLGTLMATGVLVALNLRSVVSYLSIRFGDLFSGQLDYSVSARLYFWKKCIELFSLHPLTGIGLGTMPQTHIYFSGDGYDYRMWDAHNLFLSVMAESGIVPLLALIAVLSVVFAYGVRAVRTGAAEPATLLAGIVGFLTLAVSSGAEFAHRHFIASTVVWWTMMALLVSSRQILQQRGNDVREESS